MKQYSPSSSLNIKKGIALFFILSFFISFGMFSSQFTTENTNVISDAVAVPVRTPDNGDSSNQGQSQSPTQVPAKSGNNVIGTPIVNPSMKASALPGTLGYKTTTVYKNNTNFNEATGDLVPFAEKYRINSTFNGWTSEYNTAGYPFQFHNDTLVNGSSMWSNNTIGFPMNPIQFIPGFTVNVTLAGNDTQTSGNVDL